VSHDPVFERMLQAHLNRWLYEYKLPSGYIADLRGLIQACIEQCARVAEASEAQAEQRIDSADADDLQEYVCAWLARAEEASEIASKIREVRIHA
jgi:hypothetical protein